MQVKWLLEPEVFFEDEQSVIKALTEMSVPHVVCKFGRDYDSYVQEFDPDDCVVFHGSFQFARRIQNTRWIPGVYCNKKELECLFYYPRIGKYLLNSEYTMLPFGELSRRKESLLGFNDSVFIRPSSGLKSFTGKVVTRESWSKDISLMSFYDVMPEALVVVAPPRTIHNEWRVVVVSGIVVAAAQYMKGKDFVRIGGAPEEVVQYAQEVVNASNYMPDPAWTIDIGEVDNKELKVIEVGSFSCAGFYGADPHALIQTVNAVALREWEINHGKQ